MATLPEWLVMVPAGTFSAVDGRGPFHNNDAYALMDETVAQMRGGLAIDINHSTDRAAPNGLTAPAVGWIREIKVVNGAICGRPEWNAIGRAALQNREYRFLSPVFEFDPPAGAPDGARTGVVKRIMRVSLVNDPAISELPPIKR